MLREGAEAVQAKPGGWIMFKSPRRRRASRAEHLFEREDAIESLAQVLEDFKMGLDEACNVFQGSCSWEES